MPFNPLIFLLFTYFLSASATEKLVYFYTITDLNRNVPHTFELSEECSSFPEVLFKTVSAVNTLGNCINLYEHGDCSGRRMEVSEDCEGGNCCRDNGGITQLHGRPCHFGAVAKSARLCHEQTTSSTTTTTTTTTRRPSTTASTTLSTTPSTITSSISPSTIAMLPSTAPSTTSTEMTTTEGSKTESTYLLLLYVAIGANILVIIAVSLYCCVKRKRTSLKMKKREEQQITHLIDLSIHENEIEKRRQEADENRRQETTPENVYEDIDERIPQRLRQELINHAYMSLSEHSSNSSTYEQPITRRT